MSRCTTRSANLSMPRPYTGIHSPLVLATLHLVRHGEVANPDGVVYADLPGFTLSARGQAQALAAAEHLGDGAVDAIWTSPLERATDTAVPIAAALSLRPEVDERLSEWAIALRWSGVGWGDLPGRYPGELEAYADHPTDLPFVTESLHQVAARMAAVVDDLGERHPRGTAVVVSHQDPIQALRLLLTGRDLSGLHDEKPRHAGVITLSGEATGWIETANWAPATRSAQVE